MKETVYKPFGELDIEQKIDFCTSALNVPKGMSKEEAFKRLSERIETETVSQPSHRISKGKHSLSRFFFSAAAIVIILIACGVIMSMLTKTVTAPRGSHIEYTLADGSTVNLNSDSQIKFKKYRFNKDRTIKLEGEAYFDKTPG
ncbi:MAG: FecR domain-containing protein, partial [Bacteroidales bacterium]|nr:FecR domain-containing protein [Bacteroidales bacterium]